jgi:phage-related protein (TIGR01555 family)
MAALRAGKNPNGPDGVGQNLSAKEVAAASEAAFNEFLLSGPSDETPFDRRGPFADVIPTPKLEDFKRGAAQYAEAIQRRDHDEELLSAIDPKRRKNRRNSGGSFWGGFGLPSGQQTNLTSFEPMSASIQFAPLTLQWLTLMYSYTTYGIVQRAIDVPVYDAFRGGVEIESVGNEMDAQDIEDVSEALESWGILEAFRDGNIWARTFGGGALIFNQDGEDYRTPLDMSRIGDAPVEIYDASRWELGSESRIPVSGYYDFYGLQVHASRVMTLCGKRAPFLIRDQLAGWGLSEIQRMSEDFNGYMRTKNAKFELMLEAKVDVFNIDGYKNQLASPMASQLTKRRIALINQFKSYNNALVMDKNDTYTQKQISFAGIAEMAKENRMDIAEAMQMPQSKIWGIAASGFADGEGDLESYNANVESNIREPNRPRLRRVLDMVIRAVKGGEFKFKFKYRPMRVLSSLDEESIKKSETDRILANLAAGLLSPRQAIEWQQKKGMIPIAIDTSSFSDLPGAPVSPEQEAEEELRELGQGGAEGGERRAGPAATAAAREPRAPASGAPKAEKRGEPPVRSYAEAGREPPPIGSRGGMNGGRTAEAAGVTGAGGGSSAVPWPGPQRQLEGANEAAGPGGEPSHPERPEQARVGRG